MKKLLSLVLAFLIMTSCLSTVTFADEGAYDENGKYIYRNDTYDFPMLGDPQNVTDEEFFGVWDEENQEWSIESYFNYEEYSEELADVISAAKDGDYELAKKKLMDYYVPKKYNFTSYDSTTTEIGDWVCEFLIRNVYGVNSQNSFPRGIVALDSTEWKEYSADITDFVSSSVANTMPKATLVVVSADKSNTPAEIMSKESGVAPTVTLMVNGSPRVIEAYADTYIQAGSLSSLNYGSDEVMYVQEYGYEGHWDANNLSLSELAVLNKTSGDWGIESTPTRRAYLQFDLSSLSANDDITSATLTFTARVSSGDEYDLKEKELALLEWRDNDWTENGVSWSSFTDWLILSANEQDTWDYITTDTTSTKGKICYFHRGNAVAPLASKYEITRQDKYAYTFLRQFMGLINNVGVNPSVMNCLDMSGHVRRMGDAFIKCWGSDALTPEVFTAILKHFTVMTNTVMERWIYTKRYTNNWATYATLATYSMAIIYPELKYSEEWMQATADDNRSIIIGGEVRGTAGEVWDGQVWDDGQCVELPQNYVLTLLGTYSTPIILQNRIGADSPFDDESIEKIKLIVKHLLYQSAPGYRTFLIAEDAQSINDTITIDLMNTWYKLLLQNDEEAEYVVTGGVSGKLPDFTSISYPIGLRTYMRDGWNDDSIGLAFIAKGYGSHAHKDVLSMSLWAYDTFLLTDQGYGSTLTGNIQEYMASAPQHNVVTINGGDMTTGSGKDGTEEEMELNELYNLATYSSLYYSGADYNQRSILFLKDRKFFIVNDYIEPTNKTALNTYTQFWHMHPDANIYLSDDGKYQFRSNYEGKANVIVAGVDADSMYDRYFADSVFSPSDGAFVSTQKGVYEKRVKGNATYTTVIYPLAQGDDYSVDTTSIDVGIADNKASAVWIRITDNETNEFNDYYYYHLNDASLKADGFEVTVGSYTTDASSMLIEENSKGEVTSVFIYDGTYIKNPLYTDEYLFNSTEAVNIGYKLNGSNMVEISTDEVVNDPHNERTAFSESDLQKLTIYTGTESNGAMFNGKIVSNTLKSGGYTYFGSNPIVNGTETPSNGSGNNGGSIGSGDHGGGASGGGGVPAPSTDTEEIVEPVDPILAVKTYDDVSESDWFYEYVMELTEKEVISGDGSGNFDPQSNVTREQFLKMLMVAANVETEEAENTFDDISEDDWFKPYVLKAKNFGIVNGISETSFGISSNITRQDMAVMISRTIEKLEISVYDADAEDFADEEKISDYAKDAVVFMKSIGLIEGYNNEFRPLDNLTRAEATKVISEFLNLIAEFLEDK